MRDDEVCTRLPVGAEHVGERRRNLVDETRHLVKSRDLGFRLLEGPTDLLKVGLGQLVNLVRTSSDDGSRVVERAHQALGLFDVNRPI